MAGLRKGQALYELRAYGHLPAASHVDAAGIADVPLGHIGQEMMVLGESLTFAKARHVLPEGEVAVAWRREADRILLEVACPDSVSCEILLEDGWWFREERNCSGTVVSPRSMKYP